MITKETAIVYRASKRRFLTKQAAIKSDAVSLIKEKYPTERPEYDDQGRETYPGSTVASCRDTVFYCAG